MYIRLLRLFPFCLFFVNLKPVEGNLKISFSPEARRLTLQNSIVYAIRSEAIASRLEAIASRFLSNVLSKIPLCALLFGQSSALGPFDLSVDL